MIKLTDLFDPSEPDTVPSSTQDKYADNATAMLRIMAAIADQHPDLHSDGYQIDHISYLKGKCLTAFSGIPLLELYQMALDAAAAMILKVHDMVLMDFLEIQYLSRRSKLYRTFCLETCIKCENEHGLTNDILEIEMEDEPDNTSKGISGTQLYSELVCEVGVETKNSSLECSQCPLGSDFSNPWYEPENPLMFMYENDEDFWIHSGWLIGELFEWMFNLMDECEFFPEFARKSGLFQSTAWMDCVEMYFVVKAEIANDDPENLKA